MSISSKWVALIVWIQKSFNIIYKHSYLHSGLSQVPRKNRKLQGR